MPRNEKSRALPEAEPERSPGAVDARLPGGVLIGERANLSVPLVFAAPPKGLRLPSKSIQLHGDGGVRTGSFEPVDSRSAGGRLSRLLAQAGSAIRCSH